MNWDEYDWCKICQGDFHMDQGEVIHGEFVCYDCKCQHEERLRKADNLVGQSTGVE